MHIGSNLAPMAETYEMMAAFADELATLGLRHVCISPGSRSTPLAVTFARHPDIEHSIHHDERSSAFFALGIAKTTGVPVAVVTTSGTAAAELLPAVVEARFGRVPLLALTADRPLALRGTGANQTIDQFELYGSNAKWFQDAPQAAVTDRAGTRTMAARAWGEAITAPAGPVHINFPFDEPLMPPADWPAMARTEQAATPIAALPVEADRASLAELADVMSAKRGVLIVGPLADPSFAPAIVDLARASGFPILADPLSGLRTGAHDQVIAHYDALAQAGFLDRHRPEVAIRFGAIPTSKATNTWLADNPRAAYWVIDLTGWPDPGGTAQTVLTADPAHTAAELATLVTRPAPAGWHEAWRQADVMAADALSGPSNDFTELDAIRTILESLPDPATLWVSSSMPIRQVDLLLGRSPRHVRLLANRGASGIDGFLSSGIGSAVAGVTPTYLVAGDLSTLHDLTALGWAGRHNVDVTIVVVNNNGGGIFHLLPQAPLPEFEELFGTPHGLDFSLAARLFGLDHTLATNAAELAAAVGRPPHGPRLVEMQFERSAGAAAFRGAVEQVRAALGGGE